MNTVLIGTHVKNGIVYASAQVGGGLHGESLSVPVDPNLSDAVNEYEAVEDLAAELKLGEILSSAVQAGPDGMFVTNWTVAGAA